MAVVKYSLGLEGVRKELSGTRDASKGSSAEGQGMVEAGSAGVGSSRWIFSEIGISDPHLYTLSGISVE